MRVGDVPVELDCEERGMNECCVKYIYMSTNRIVQVTGGVLTSLVFFRCPLLTTLLTSTSWLATIGLEREVEAVVALLAKIADLLRMELGEKATAEERIASVHAVVNFIVDYLFFLFSLKFDVCGTVL